MDDTLQNATGGTAPRLPKPNAQLPSTDVGIGGTGGGSSGSTLPDVGGLRVPRPSVEVQTPGVTAPQTGVTVPETRLRLP